MSDLPAESPERTVAMLEGSAGDRIPRFPLWGAVVTIGQGPRNEIVLEDETVSTSHARLEHAGGEWRLTDLRSRNGTWVDGVRLEAEVPTPLTDGIPVAFGAVRLTFRANAATGPEPAVPPARPAPAPEGESVSAGFRLPVWVFVLVILAIAALVFLVLTVTGEPTVTEPLTGAAAALLSTSVSRPASGPISAEDDAGSTAGASSPPADHSTA